MYSMRSFHFTQNDRSALMRAVSEGHTEIVVELVKARANLDLQDEVCLDSCYGGLLSDWRVHLSRLQGYLHVHYVTGP